MHCSDDQLIAFLDDELWFLRKKRVQKHLSSCWSCRTRLADYESRIHHLTRDFEDWSVPGPRWSVDAKMELADGMRRIDSTLPKPGRSHWRAVFPRPWLSAAALLAVAVLTSVVMLQRRYTVTEPAPGDALARLAAVERTLNGHAVAQTFAVELSEIRPVRTSQKRNLQIWSDADSGRFASRWTDSRGELKHALLKPKDGVELVFTSAARRSAPRVSAPSDDALDSLGSGDLSPHAIEAAFLRWLESRSWRPISFAADFSLWSRQDGTEMKAERTVRPDGTASIRITARRTSRRVVAVLTIDVDAFSFRPRLETIRFETPERAVELRLAATSITPMPSRELPAEVFADPVAPAPAPIAVSPIEPPRVNDDSRTAETPVTGGAIGVIEARFLLHQAAACTGEPVEISEENGRVRIRHRNGGGGLSPVHASLTDVLAALSDLRRSAAATPADAPQFARLDRSSLMLLHATALRNLAERFAGDPVMNSSPDASKWLSVMIADHADAIAREMERFEVIERASDPAPPRQWRESATTLYDKIRLLDELIRDDQSAEATPLLREISVELQSIRATFPTRRQ